MLIDTIRVQKTEARKSSYRAIEVAILNLLIGEIETVEKRTGKIYTDAQVVDAIKKLIKSNDESLKHRANPKLDIENRVLTALLPKQLTEQQIRDLIATNGLVGVPAVMQYLNANYAGQFDKSLASSIARS
ncbi:Yqey-like protein [compost metagenome]